jgi:hypothetical protein
MFLPGVPGELFGERELEDWLVIATEIERQDSIGRVKGGHGHFSCGLVQLDGHDRAAPGRLAVMQDDDGLADHAPAKEPFCPSDDVFPHFNPPGSFGHSISRADHLQSGHFGLRPVFQPCWAAFL